MRNSCRDRVGLSKTLGERLAQSRTVGDDKVFADAVLRQAGADRLLWVVAPDVDGEPPLSISDIARITFNIARLSGSAGLIYAMHMSQALTLVRHAGGSTFFQKLINHLTQGQVLVASGTSEKGVGGDIFGSICTIVQDGNGGLALTKESPNISYLDHADLVLISAMRENDSGRKTQVLVAAVKENMVCDAGPEAGFIGMRGILNRPYKLTATFSEDAIFDDPYPVIARQTMTPSIHIFWAALWSGIAASALAKARACVAGLPKNDGEIADLMRADLSRLVDRHYTMNALIRDAIADFDRGDTSQAIGIVGTARVKRLKTSCSDLLTEICIGVLGILGIRGYAESGPMSMSEILRDSMSAGVMISNYRLLANNSKIERYIEEGL
jgi:acyl-CoA dehydrogenase